MDREFCGGIISCDEDRPAQFKQQRPDSLFSSCYSPYCAIVDPLALVITAEIRRFDS